MSSGPAAGPARQPSGSGPVAALRDLAPVAYTPKHLADRILGSRAAGEGERKHVTVMFADVSGFTAMSSRLDPEEVHGIMDRAFEVILDAVHRYEGTVNQFLGDGVMALFGAPIAHEDHPHRALRAALAIQHDLSTLRHDVRERHGVNFQIRMGINTGLVVVGSIGRDLRMDYTAIGDTTNLAARLLGIAGPGQIVVSKQTHRPTDGFFTFEDLGEFVVKGKDEPVRAFAVIDEIRGRTRLDVSRERGLTPFAGRQAELGRLTAAYERAVAGDGRVVLLTGEPGAGKSRLLYELLHRLEGTDALELEAGCVSHGRSIPYHPVIELVRRCLALPEGAADAEIYGRAAEYLRSVAEIDEEPALLLAHFLGAPAPAALLARLGGPRLKERTHAVLRDLLLGTARARPAVVVVENLHWADPSSEELLRTLAASVRGHRLLLLLTARPGHALAGLGDGVETLALGGLGQETVLGMARGILGVETVSPGLLETLMARSEGNPLFVEELLRQLQETGRLAVEDGEAGLRGTDPTMPKSIHDIIAARIDRLAEPVRQTLRVASVVGRSFDLPLLARVLGTDEPLESHLRDLHALDLVFPTDQAPGPAYAFRHALIQEVAYESLLERHRRLHHALVGRGLEEVFAGRTEEVVGLLAHHFWRSGEDDKAVDYAILAGREAQRRWAQTEALAQFEGALKRLAGMADDEANRRRRIDALVEQSEIRFALGHHAEHVRSLEAIRDLVQAAADPPRRAAWCCWAGFFHTLTGAPPEVPIGYCRDAVRIAESAGLGEIRARAEMCLGQVYVFAGALREALEAGERALEAFEARGDVWWACRTLWGLSMAANAVGDWTRSLAYCRRALAHGKTANDLRLRVVGWWRTGSTCIQQGALQQGLRCCEEALALSPVAFDAAMIRAVQAYGRVKLGDAQAGTAALAEAIGWFDRSHLRYTRSVVALWLAEGWLRLGEAPRARAIVGEALAAARELGYRHLEGVAERLLGEALVRDDPRAALERLCRAEEVLQEIGALNEVGKTLVARAELAGASGERPAARELLGRALGIFARLGTLDELSRAELALASLGEHEDG